jgi:uncharacterized protein (DUF1501 family)
MQRRAFLQTTSALGALSFAAFQSPFANAQDHAPRILVVLLRGGMDGLTAVAPVGDSIYTRIRPTTAVQQTLRLDGSFGLHPALSHLHSIWSQGQLAIVHSTGFDYSGRSHFEGQDIMQTGMTKPYTSPSGWLGRAMQVANAPGGVAISIPMPLILRGNPDSVTQYPNWMPSLRRDVADLLPALWAQDDVIAPYANVIREQNMNQIRGSMSKENFENSKSWPELGRLAGLEMRQPNGPRVGLIDFTHGFDTHASQGAEQGVHAQQLKELDRLVQAFQAQMGDAWRKTVVVTVTEFGRTAAENGTTGTDHGVGTCCFLAGGLIDQSKVFAEWRGLKPEQLFEGRDLPASIDVAAVYAKVMERVFGISPQKIQDQVIAHKPHAALKGLLGIG